jgi:hypothetical protein
MKAVLVATIGTRDLIFQVSSSGKWHNIGDDRMKDGDYIGEQAEVISDLSLTTPITYRDLTDYLLKNIDKYRDRIKPVIIGKLLSEKAADIEKVYLIGTNQNPEVPEREKDTLYACELIKSWLAHNYPHITVEVIYLGDDGTNPANFEQMFSWWRQTWKKINPQPEQPIWLSLKGGVGQAAEAARISGLSLYGDRIQFFEFHQDSKANQAGILSNYTGPFLGTNYLWDRTQQQALKLLERYDYAEVLDLLAPYFKQDTSRWGAVPNLLKAGLAWNQGKFETFFQFAKSSLALQKQQTDAFGWQAYEEAYLALIRLQQNNTTEAMFHSFRAVEGLLSKWVTTTFTEVTARPDKYATLNHSIVTKYPALKKLFERNGQKDEIKLELWVMQCLLEADFPEVKTSQDWVMFCQNAVKIRNKLFHQIGGLTEMDLFKAWGDGINNQSKWENRILNCLNLVTKNKFQSLSQASLFASIHEQAQQAIKEYQPSQSLA